MWILALINVSGIVSCFWVRVHEIGHIEIKAYKINHLLSFIIIIITFIILLLLFIITVIDWMANNRREQLRDPVKTVSFRPGGGTRKNSPPVSSTKQPLRSSSAPAPISTSQPHAYYRTQNERSQNSDVKNKDSNKAAKKLPPLNLNKKSCKNTQIQIRPLIQKLAKLETI